MVARKLAEAFREIAGAVYSRFARFTGKTPQAISGLHFDRQRTERHRRLRIQRSQDASIVDDVANSTRKRLIAEAIPDVGNAKTANDGDNPAIRCTHMDVLRADGLEKRAKYLDELASKECGPLILERARISSHS